MVLEDILPWSFGECLQSLHSIAKRKKFLQFTLMHVCNRRGDFLATVFFTFFWSLWGFFHFSSSPFCFLCFSSFWHPLCSLLIYISIAYPKKKLDLWFWVQFQLSKFWFCLALWLFGVVLPKLNHQNNHFFPCTSNQIFFFRHGARASAPASQAVEPPLALDKLNHGQGEWTTIYIYIC